MTTPLTPIPARLVDLAGELEQAKVTGLPDALDAKADDDAVMKLDGDQTVTGDKTLSDKLIRPYFAPTVMRCTEGEGASFSVYHRPSTFDGEIVHIDNIHTISSYNDRNADDFLPGVPTYDLTHEGDYFPDTEGNYRTSELNLDYYSNEGGEDPFNIRQVAISVNRITNVGETSQAGGRFFWRQNDSSAVFLDMRSHDVMTGLPVAEAYAKFFVFLSSTQRISGSEFRVNDKPYQIACAQTYNVNGANPTLPSIYSGYNFVWNNANQRYEHQDATVSAGIAYDGTGGTLVFYSDVARAAGTAITPGMSLDRGALAIGGAYNGTSGVGIDCLKTTVRIRASEGQFLAVDGTINVMLTASAIGSGGKFGTVSAHDLNIFTGNTRKGAFGNDGGLYWGSAFPFRVTAAGAVTAPSVAIGGGTPVTKIVSATATLDFGSTAAQASADLTVSVTGAAIGDTVSLGLPASPAANTSLFGWVSAADTVTVRHCNFSASPVDPASGSYRVTVTKF